MIKLKNIIQEDSQFYKIIDARDLDAAYVNDVVYKLPNSKADRTGDFSYGAYDAENSTDQLSEFVVRPANENTYVVKLPAANVVIGTRCIIGVTFPRDWYMQRTGAKGWRTFSLGAAETSGGALKNNMTDIHRVDDPPYKMLRFYIQFKIPETRLRSTKPTYKFKCGSAKNGELIFTCDLSKLKYIEDPELPNSER
tara:strand:- start:125 stop:712 length:588 start_codon:yes stop_codon:yes gene_type:complete